MTKTISLGFIILAAISSTTTCARADTFTAYDTIRIDALLTLKHLPGGKTVPDERLCRGHSYLASIGRSLDELSGSGDTRVIANHRRLVAEYQQLESFCAHAPDPVTHRKTSSDDAVNSARALYGLSIEGIKISKTHTVVDDEAQVKHVAPVDPNDAPTPECGVQWGGGTAAH